MKPYARALEAARTLENSIDRLGEMGVDIGVDRDGHIWFIEANLKPGRQSQSAASNPDAHDDYLQAATLCPVFGGVSGKTVEP